MPKKPDIKGLHKLYEIIKAAPNEAFNWHVFAHNDRDDSAYKLAHHLRETLRDGTPHCGTVACIAGWATVSHPRRLVLSANGLVKTRDRRREGHEAFASAFGLSEEDAYNIVHGFENHPNTKRSALSALKKLIRRLEARAKFFKDLRVVEARA